MICADDPKEMCPVLPIDPLLVDEAQIRFVDEGGRLQAVAGPLATELTPGNAAQLGVDERQQLIESTVIPVSPIVEQGRDVRRRGPHRLLSKG